MGEFFVLQRADDLPAVVYENFVVAFDQPVFIIVHVFDRFLRRDDFHEAVAVVPFVFRCAFARAVSLVVVSVRIFAVAQDRADGNYCPLFSSFVITVRFFIGDSHPFPLRFRHPDQRFPPRGQPLGKHTVGKGQLGTTTWLQKKARLQKEKRHQVTLSQPK